jgi:hypothetical protein
VTTAAAALIVAGGIVAYADVASDRLPWVVGCIGVAGCALMAVAFVARKPTVLAFGLAGVGAAYGVFLSLRSGDVDARAPLVAAALLVAAELGFSSLERTSSRSDRLVVVRRIAGLAGAALLTGLVGSLVLVLTTGSAGGLALEAAGVGAAVLAVATIARLVSRASV